MSIDGKDRYKITGADVDLAAEVIIDSDGRRIDQAYVDEVVASAHEVLDKRTGRPSLTGKAEHSPQVTFRITPELKARAEHAAAEQGVKDVFWPTPYLGGKVQLERNLERAAQLALIA